MQSAGERAGLRDAPACRVSSPIRAVQRPRMPIRRRRSTAWRVRCDGAESSHGGDMAMWRPDPSGPQGPMQVSEAAATDVGGGDRFDSLQNRAIGRAYLLQLYGRYGNWPDAIAAYNWGIGKMNAWVKAGRPPDQFLLGVAAYLRRVLHESGLCDSAETGRHRQPSEEAREPGSAPPDSLVYAACSGPDAWAAASGFGGGPTRFSRKLDQALQLALQRASAGQVIGVKPRTAKLQCARLYSTERATTRYLIVSPCRGAVALATVLSPPCAIGLLRLAAARQIRARRCRANIVPCL